MAGGFFLVLTIEILAMDHQKRSAKRGSNNHSGDHSEISNGSCEKASCGDTKKEIELAEKQGLANGNAACVNGHAGDSQHHHCHIITDGIDGCANTAAADIHGITYQHTGHDHHASRSLILIVALSLHRIFEGWCCFEFMVMRHLNYIIKSQ